MKTPEESESKACSSHTTDYNNYHRFSSTSTSTSLLDLDASSSVLTDPVNIVLSSLFIIVRSSLLIAVCLQGRRLCSRFWLGNIWSEEKTSCVCWIVPLFMIRSLFVVEILLIWADLGVKTLAALWVLNFMLYFEMLLRNRVCIRFFAIAQLVHYLFGFGDM